LAGDVTFRVLLSERRERYATFDKDADRTRLASYVGCLMWREHHEKGFTLCVNEGNYTSKQRDGEEPVPAGTIGRIFVKAPAKALEPDETPFLAGIFLSPSNYDEVVRLIENTLDAGFQAFVALKVRSSQLDKDTVFARPDDLDYSAGLQEPVIGVSVSVGRNRLTRDAPVKLPSNWHKLDPASQISVELDDVWLTYRLPSGRLGDLQIAGHIRDSSNKDIDDCGCEVELMEYERDEFGLYPKESLSGSFFWHKDLRSLSLTLYYRSADIDGAFAGLFRARPVSIRATLLTDLADFRRGDQSGAITNWSLTFRATDLGQRVKRAHRHYVAEFIIGLTAVPLGAVAWFIADQFVITKALAPTFALAVWLVSAGMLRKRYQAKT
jgi:hypothetical protein